jgi:hypothetical protein
MTSNRAAPCTLIDVMPMNLLGRVIERDNPRKVFLPVATKARGTLTNKLLFKRDRRRKD